ALPNWAHDALLKSSSSKPQDHCSTEDPKGSGNPNPTASTSNLPADLMEILTVESLIPTVSSPVLTVYSTDSQEPSSDARLILKRVANQEETPSLDNILSLKNRFEDILRVTTNSDESNGVEADISNMETAITASPTPTLRIHKDHPKKPKKISDALQDPSWVEAMQEKLLQFKIQNVWTLVDCPKGDPKFPANVYKVKKAMYGLHQAPRASYALMREKFQMNAMGELNFFLGLQVLQKEDGIFLFQDKYVGDSLKKFRYSDVRSSNTPMDKENPWGKDETGKDVD
nr:hypothetical protein [Tanacetum cinerariifolium]